MGWMTVWWQTGQVGSALAQRRVAQSMQKRLWPQGTRAAFTSRSLHTWQSRLPTRLSVGEAECGGDGRAENDQMLEEAVAVSKEGDSPIPSSLSRDVPQMEPRSPSPVPPEAEELEDAELQPELPLRVDDGNMLSEGIESMYVNRLPKPDL